MGIIAENTIFSLMCASCQKHCILPFQLITIGKLSIWHVLESYDEKPLKCLCDEKGLTKFVNVSVNLANLAHYNMNSDGVGIGVWFEKDKHLGMEVFYVMPNILVKDIDNVAWKSLLIKLKDGCIILWDGTNICHCTSWRIDPKNLWKIWA